MTRVRSKRPRIVGAFAIPDPNYTSPHKHKFGFLSYVFCSYEHNHHKPFILRKGPLLAISFLAVFFLGISFARYYFLHKTVLGQEIVSSVLIDLTNETRIKYGESPLIRSAKLELASNLKAQDMATHQYFAHNSPTGVTPWHWLEQAQYSFIYAGENLAIDFVESKDVEEAWLKSPTHRANILNGKFQEIGISTQEGTFNGHNTIYVVQMFGTPKNPATLAENLPQKSSPESDLAKAPATSKQTEEDPKVAKEGEVAGAETQDEASNSATKLTQIDQVENTNARSSSGTALQTANTLESAKYVTLLDEHNTLVVADREALENSSTAESVLNTWTNEGELKVHYANFWQKLIYNFWFEINLLYKIAMGAIMLSIILLFFTEFKKHHWWHILYGVIAISILLTLLYFNQALW